MARQHLPVHRSFCSDIRAANEEVSLLYQELGRTGISVSKFGLGAMTFGGQTAEADSLRQLDMARDAGINLFDTAENYPTPISADTQGRSEAILGNWIAANGARDKVVIATKVAGPGNAAGDLPSANSRRFSATKKATRCCMCDC